MLADTWSELEIIRLESAFDNAKSSNIFTGSSKSFSSSPFEQSSRAVHLGAVDSGAFQLIRSLAASSIRVANEFRWFELLAIKWRFTPMIWTWPEYSSRDAFAANAFLVNSFFWILPGEFFSGELFLVNSSYKRFWWTPLVNFLTLAVGTEAATKWSPKSKLSQPKKSGFNAFRRESADLSESQANDGRFASWGNFGRATPEEVARAERAGCTFGVLIVDHDGWRSLGVFHLKFDEQFSFENRKF